MRTHIMSTAYSAVIEVCRKRRGVSECAGLCDKSTAEYCKDISIYLPKNIKTTLIDHGYL